MPRDHDAGAAVPIGRVGRLLQFGGIATAIAGGVAASGLRALAQGRRPDAAQLLLTPANMLRLTRGLSHLRGAALKLGQILSMDAGLALPDEPTAILGAGLMALIALSTVPACQLMPATNHATDAGVNAQFKRLHGLSVMVTLVHTGIAEYALARFVGGTPA